MQQNKEQKIFSYHTNDMFDYCQHRTYLFCTRRANRMFHCDFPRQHLAVCRFCTAQDWRPRDMHVDVCTQQRHTVVDQWSCRTWTNTRVDDLDFQPRAFSTIHISLWHCATPQHPCTTHHVGRVHTYVRIGQCLNRSSIELRRNHRPWSTLLIRSWFWQR